jgi:hypothetical protein
VMRRPSVLESMPATADELDQAGCPGCGGAPRLLSGIDWLFRCDACSWAYGHPQFMSRDRASEVLHDMKQPKEPTHG